MVTCIYYIVWYIARFQNDFVDFISNYHLEFKDSPFKYESNEF